MFNKINHKKSTMDYCLIIIKHRYFNSKSQVQMLAQCIQEEEKIYTGQNEFLNSGFAS